MKLKIEITMNSAAFAPCPAPEVVRILRDLAGDIEGHLALSDGGDHETLRDVNGNAVGKAQVTR